MLDDLLEEPRDTPWNKWACGVAFPVLLSLWATRVMFVQKLTLLVPLRRFRYLRYLRYLRYSGSEAWWLGLAMLGMAAMMHCHFFWTNQPRLAPYADLGKVASLVAIVVGLGFVAVSMCQPF